MDCKIIVNNKFSISVDGDVLCFIDFRADRMRQINEAFGIKPPFETDVIPKDLVSIYMNTETNNTKLIIKLLTARVRGTQYIKIYFLQT